MGCALLPIPAVGGIARMVKGADKALDAGKALDKGQDFSGFFKAMDDYPEFAKLPAHVKESFAGWAWKVDFPRGAFLTRYGEEGGKFYTGLVSSRLDEIESAVAWKRSGLLNGAGTYWVPPGKSGWMGLAGPQRLDDAFLKTTNLSRGGAMQVYFPDPNGIVRMIP